MRLGIFCHITLVPREIALRVLTSLKACFGLRRCSMNQKLFTSPATWVSKLPLSIAVAALTLVLNPCLVHSQAPKNQAPKKSATPSPSIPKAVPGQGYLSKAAPSGLRFAPPPKPPVAYLPPLPITYDPQPVFSSDFAPPTDFLAGKSPAPSDQPLKVVGPSVTSLVSNFTTSRVQGQIPAAPVDLGSVSPQMLVRFFPSGKPNEVELLLTNAVTFRVPVREDKPSSAASYEVK
jgi:hypothetical protein